MKKINGENARKIIAGAGRKARVTRLNGVIRSAVIEEGGWVFTLRPLGDGREWCVSRRRTISCTYTRPALAESRALAARVFEAF